MGKLNWNPWMGMEDIQDESDRFEREHGAGQSRMAGREKYVWQPAADIYETREEVVLQVELPGLHIEDVILEVREDELWLYGKRRFEKDVENSVYHALERSYGEFARKFSLPSELDTESIAARLKDGLLEVRIPIRKGATGSTRITVES